MRYQTFRKLSGNNGLINAHRYGLVSEIRGFLTAAFTICEQIIHNQAHTKHNNTTAYFEI